MEDMRAGTQICKNCGRKLIAGAAFCGGCGTPVENSGSGGFTDYSAETESAGYPEYSSKTEPETFPEYGTGSGSGSWSEYDTGSGAKGYSDYNAYNTDSAGSGTENYAGHDTGSPAGNGGDGGYSDASRAAAEKASALLRDAAAAGGAIGSAIGRKAKEAARDSKRRYDEWQEDQMSGSGKSLGDEGTYNKAVRHYFLNISRRSLYCFLAGLAAFFLFSLFGSIGGRSGAGKMMMIGTFLFWIGLIAALIFKFIPDYTGQKDADDAKRREIRRMRKRGLEKLNVEMEEISLIDPVILYGPGVRPNDSLGQEDPGKVFILLRPLVALIRWLFSRVNKYDPVVLYRIGSDDIFRYMLLQVTVYAFSNEQVLVYSGNVDTSTGRIYDETIMEVFYRDISKVATNQELTKALKGRKFRYYVNEYVELSGPGFKHLAAVASSLDNRKTDEEFLGMKNLIRDKKREMT